MELCLLILALVFSSTVGLNLDKEALVELSEEDQALVQNQINNFLDAAGQKIANALEEKNNVDVRRAHSNVPKINKSLLATAPYYYAQQWPLKNADYCALITWIKWALQTIRFVYEKGLDILRIHASLNL